MKIIPSLNINNNFHLTETSAKKWKRLNSIGTALSQAIDSM